MIKTGVSALLATSALVSFSIFAPGSALAQCVPAPGNYGSPGVNADCTGFFNSNINYNTADGLGGFPINLTLDPGVIVISPGGNAVNTNNTGGVTAGAADITITADGVTINNTANSAGNNNTGLRIQSSGNASITATNTTINVAGTASDWAILAFAMPNQTGASHVASVNYIQGTAGLGLTSTVGVEGGAIQADNRGVGDAIITASGGINVSAIPGVANGTTQYGLLAHAGDPTISGVLGAGNASVTYNSGTINVSAIRPRGILAWVDGNGSATATTGAGTVINVSGSQFGGPGVYVFTSGTAAAPNELRANVASSIMSVGPADPTNSSNLPVGIRANNSGTDAPIVVNYTGPGITTVGGNGSGILTASGSGSIIVNASGPINTTDGSNAVGILADSGAAFVQNSGLLTDAITIRQSPTSTTGSVQVNATNVSTLGQFGTGISATAGSGGVTANIAQGGSVMGGWQADPADPTEVGSTYGLPAAGVVLGSAGGTATLTNNGSIGALSDRAVASIDVYRPGFAGHAGGVNIVNNGTITGYVTLGAGNDTFSNLSPNSFDIRNFADTNGDGIRDTKGVAISDFGAGNDQFLNEANGVVRLLPVTGAATTDATGYYVPTTGLDSRPLEASFYDLNREGIVQGQLVNLETFSNAGTIDLRNAAVGNAPPVVGNTLVITGNAAAGGAPGTGLYVSNGGRLLVNTVLNGGIPIGGQTNSYSDMLIVDGTQLGAGGATAISVTNVGGSGRFDPGQWHRTRRGTQQGRLGCGRVCARRRLCHHDRANKWWLAALMPIRCNMVASPVSCRRQLVSALATGA